MRRFGVVDSFWRNRQLIWQLTRRDVSNRYRGSFLGFLWSFFNPLFMLAVYTFVFSVVFQARWGSSGESKAEFAIILFSGLIIYTFFSDCINRAPNLILSNVNYVKKVVFPLEILPWVVLGESLFHVVTSVIVLLVISLLILGTIHWTVILLPLALFPLIPLIMGVSWFLASVGVFVRDVGQIVQIITVALMFMSPIFYPISALPENYRNLLYLNPLTFIIMQVREVMIWGKSPNWTGLAVYFVVSLIFAWLGLLWFNKTRRGFGDVV